MPAQANPYRAGDVVIMHPNMDRASLVGCVIGTPDRYHVDVQWERGGRLHTERAIPIRWVHPVTATCPIGAC